MGYKGSFKKWTEQGETLCAQNNPHCFFDTNFLNFFIVFYNALFFHSEHSVNAICETLDCSYI